MPRFVLLFHDWPEGPRQSHCDLMFETGESLATWALTMLPSNWQTLFVDPQLKFASMNSIDAERLPDHRIAYLEYEGAVSDGRGTVRRLDFGIYSTEKERYEFDIDGKLLQGTISLQPPTENHDLWHLTFTARSVP